MRNVLQVSTVLAFASGMLLFLGPGFAAQSASDYFSYLSCYRQLYALEPEYAHSLGDIGGGGGEGHVIVTPVAPGSAAVTAPGLYVQTDRGGMRFGYPSAASQDQCRDGFVYRLDQHWTSSPGAKLWKQSFFRVTYQPARVEKVTATAVAEMRKECVRTVSDNDGSNWDEQDQAVMKVALAKLLDHVLSQSSTAPSQFCKSSACEKVLGKENSKLARACPAASSVAASPVTRQPGNASKAN